MMGGLALTIGFYLFIFVNEAPCAIIAKTKSNQ